MNNFKNDTKMSKERAKYLIYCNRCGHSLVFYPFKHINKKICSYCGYYVYKNNKIEFKERLELLL